ncbi:hypothetical protein PEC18_36275 [Paucibacter sp. O1-1]|nr:hypothetical protein [Paucibacter sp. O1-1]MDA3831111.1 hypothetical protein [Paucibacter sp. O1-1]
MNRTVSSHQGFTYVGVLILLAVLSMAAALTLQFAQTRAQRDAETELLGVGQEFERAFASYHRQTPVGQRPFPEKLEDLLRDPRYPGVRRHLRRLYVDPLSGKAWGLVPAPGGGVMGIYSRAEGKPFRQDIGQRALPPLPPGAASAAIQGAVIATTAQLPMLAASPASVNVGDSYAQWRFGYDPQLDLQRRNNFILPTRAPQPGQPSQPAP